MRPGPGLPLVHFNDTGCGRIAELRSDPRRRPSGRGATNQLALTTESSKRRELCDAVPPSSIPLPRAGCVPSAECEDFNPANKRRSLGTEACQPEVESKFSLQWIETNSDATRCSARIAYLGDPRNHRR